MHKGSKLLFKISYISLVYSSTNILPLNRHNDVKKLSCLEIYDVIDPFQRPSFISSSCTCKLLAGVGEAGWEESITRLFILDNLSIPTCIACSSISEAQYTSISIPSSFKAWNPEIVKRTGYIGVLPFDCSKPLCFSRYHGHNFSYARSHFCNSIYAVCFYLPKGTCKCALLRQIS